MDKRNFINLLVATDFSGSLDEYIPFPGLEEKKLGIILKNVENEVRTWLELGIECHHLYFVHYHNYKLADVEEINDPVRFKEVLVDMSSFSGVGKKQNLKYLEILRNRKFAAAKMNPERFKETITHAFLLLNNGNQYTSDIINALSFRFTVPSFTVPWVLPREHRNNVELVESLTNYARERIESELIAKKKEHQAEILRWVSQWGSEYNLTAPESSAVRSKLSDKDVAQKLMSSSEEQQREYVENLITTVRKDLDYLQDNPEKYIESKTEWIVQDMEIAPGALKVFTPGVLKQGITQFLAGSLLKSQWVKPLPFFETTLDGVMVVLMKKRPVGFQALEVADVLGLDRPGDVFVGQVEPQQFEGVRQYLSTFEMEKMTFSGGKLRIGERWGGPGERWGHA